MSTSPLGQKVSKLTSEFASRATASEDPKAFVLAFALSMVIVEKVLAKEPSVEALVSMLRDAYKYSMAVGLNEAQFASFAESSEVVN